MDPSEIMGLQEEESALGGGGGADYGMMMQPQIDFSQYIRPIANPEEGAARRSMWSQIATKFQTDPNLQRAMALTGAMLMQPVRPGQTTGSTAANAGVVGLNAYNMGQQAEFEQGMKRSAESRAERSLGIQESQEARAAGREPLERERITAGTEGTRASTQFTRQRIDDAIADAKEKKDATGLRELLRQVQEEEAKVKLGVGTDTRIAAEYDRLKAERIKLQAAEQQLRSAGATTRLTSARAEEQELTNESLRGMSPAERLRALGKGRAAGSSAVVQQYDMWAEAFDRMHAKNPNDPELKGLDRDKFATKKLSESKTQDAAATLAKLLAAGLDEDDPLITQLREDITRRRPGATSPAAAPGTPAPRADTKSGKEKGSSESNPLDWPGEEGYASIPKGSWYRDPNGKVRRKR